MKTALWRLMQEALRRYCLFHAGKPVTQAWTGLGTAAEYRPAIEAGLMEWVSDVPAPRHSGWLRLTEKGGSIILKWMAAGYNDVNEIPLYSGLVQI